MFMFSVLGLWDWRLVLRERSARTSRRTLEMRPLSGLIAAGAIGVLGLFYGGLDSVEASYWSKSTSCGLGSTCVSQTTTKFAEDTHQARGRSYTSSTSYPEFFAWTRGTNIYHVGQIFEQYACQVQNGQSCDTAWAFLCGSSAYPVGCGSGGGGSFCNNYCYLTTWSWFKRSGVEYALFTATRNGADSSYCWTTMTCI